VIAVLDTNVVVSALLKSGGASAHVMRACLDGLATPVTTKALSAELERVLGYPRIASRLGIRNTHQWAPFVDYLDSCLVVEAITSLSGVTRDADDDRVLEAAIDGPAQYIITGDSDLPTLGRYAGIEIVTPARFVEILDEQDKR
jgi:uncharacterized protein